MSMKTLLTAALAFLLLLPCGLYAQSPIAGKWQGKTPNGFTLELDLIVTGDAVTGTFKREGDSLPITDGKIAKNTLTFTVILRDQVERLSAEVTGDDMKAWLDRQGPTMAASLKRVIPGAVAPLAGAWEGATATGRPLLLELRVQEAQLTGRLTLEKLSVDIIQGKTDGQTFSFTAGQLDGRAIVATGKLADGDIRLMVEGVANPVTLKRVKK